MSYLDLAQRIRLRFDRKKVGSPTLNSQPGAHTGNARQYIPGYSDANIVFLNTSTGNDGNTGASIAQAVLTYAQAATLASTTKKIRVVNDGAALAVNITKPTEMTRGTTGTISGSTSTPVATFTASASTTAGRIVNATTWSPLLSKFVACGTVSAGGASFYAYSTNGTTWTDSASTTAATDMRAVCWSPELKIFVAAGGNTSTVKTTYAYSTDGITWTDALTTDDGFITGISWSRSLGLFVSVGYTTAAGSLYQYSTDGINWTTSASSTALSLVRGVTWSDSLAKFVAVGYTTVFGSYFSYSSDGMSWTDSASTTALKVFNAVAWSESLGYFVAVGATTANASYHAYSTDGITWSNSASTTASRILLGVTWSQALGLFLACGYTTANASFYSYSSDGTTWTNSAATTASRYVYGIAWSPLLNIFAGAGYSTGNASYFTYSATLSITISAAICGFNDVKAALFSGTLTAYGCTIRAFGTSAAVSMNACRVTGTGCHISANTLSLYQSLFEGDLSLTSVPATDKAIALNTNTVAGSLKIFNSSETHYEQLRDNIIEGGLYATYSVIVTSGNIRGTRSNAIVTRAVSFSDPVFVNTTDYKLKRITNGDSQDSPLVNASAYYVNEQGQPRDFGAWSYDDSTLPYEYRQTFFLLKPKDQGIRPEKLPAASADQGMDGTWDAVNEPVRATEYLTLQYGSGVPVDHITCQDLLESLTDLTCEISLAPDQSDPDTDITVNGSHAVGDCVLNIDASTTITSGMILTIGSYKYYVLYVAPSTSPTKLVLHQPLLSTVADNLVITPQEPAAYGTYQYIPQSRQIPRPQSQETEYVNGAVFKFVRQYPQL